MHDMNTLLLVSFAGLLSAGDNWVATLLLPNIANDFASTIPQASIVLTAYLIPYGAMQPIYGHYSDQYHKKYVLMLLMCGLSLTTFLCSVAPSLYTLTAFRFATGLFAAGIVAVSLGILGEHYDREILPKFVSLFLGIIFLGQGISAGIGGIVIQSFSWRTILAAFSILSLLSFSSLCRLTKKSSLSAATPFLPSLKTLLEDKQLSLAYLLAFCNGFITLGMYSYLGAYLIEILHVPYTNTGFLLMLFGVMCFWAGYINKYLLKHFSRDHLVRIGFLSTWAALLLLIFENTPATLLAIILLGIGYIFIQSILASTALHTSTHKGLSSGIIGIAIFGGGGLGTYVNSLILGTFYFPALILFLLVLESIIVFASFKIKISGNAV